MSKLDDTHIRLKTSRIAAGYRTAINFCEKNQIPVSTYNMHETGKRKISADVAENYAFILGISASWLLTGDGDPYPGSNSESTAALSEDEYLKLLNYSGNYKIPTTQVTPFILEPIHAVLFCKIFNEIVQVLTEFKTSLSIQHACHYATEIYEDILETSHILEEQMTMISLAITIFKKKIQQSIQGKELSN
jgi:hypothetical protein